MNTTYSLELIGSGDGDRWQGWLDRAPHDFYHTAAYHRFAEQCGEGQALLAVYGDRSRYLAWPYLLREIPQHQAPPLRDVASVYGYAGPVAAGWDPADPFFERARLAIADLWRSQRAVSAFTRFHPLLENHRFAGDCAGGTAPAGQTVSIDLTLEPAELRRQYQPSLRNRIHRGRRLGLETVVDESWSCLEDFVRFYRATMARHGAAPYYWFSLDDFRRLRECLGRHAFLLVTRLREQAVAAAAILVEYRGMVANHFTMNNDGYLDLAPSKVLLDDAVVWARERGNRVFHLGGGRGAAADSLFAFKAAFSRRRHPFHIGRAILDWARYTKLCERLPQAVSGYFPAYRAAAAAPAGPPA